MSGELSHFVILIGTMLAAGLGVGFINYKVWQHRPDRESPLRVNLLIAGGGAFLVPVVLTLVSSDLIANAGEMGMPLVRYFGLSFATAILAVSIVLILPKLMGRPDIVVKPAVKVSPKNDITPPAAAPSSSSTENTTDSEEAKPSSEAPKSFDFPDTEKSAFKALHEGEYPYRAVKGLCKQTGLDNFDLLTALEGLKEKGLVSSVNTQKGIRWHLTDEGKAYAQGQQGFSF